VQSGRSIKMHSGQWKVFAIHCVWAEHSAQSSALLAGDCVQCAVCSVAAHRTSVRQVAAALQDCYILHTVLKQSDNTGGHLKCVQLETRCPNDPVRRRGNNFVAFHCCSPAVGQTDFSAGSWRKKGEI